MESNYHHTMSQPSRMCGCLAVTEVVSLANSPNKAHMSTSLTACWIAIFHYRLFNNSRKMFASELYYCWSAIQLHTSKSSIHFFLNILNVFSWWFYVYHLVPSWQKSLKVLEVLINIPFRFFYSDFFLHGKAWIFTKSSPWLDCQCSWCNASHTLFHGDERCIHLPRIF